MRKNWFIYFFVLVFIPIAQHAYGVDLFSQCTRGFDFGATPTKQITVYPLNSTCAKSCAAQCQIFSVSVGSADNPIELNSDIITNCRVACQTKGRPCGLGNSVY